MLSYLNCFSKYAVFRGRSARKEFWSFSIWNAIIVVALLLLHAKFATGFVHTLMTVLVIAYVLFSVCPLLAVTARRWHDLDRTASWLWLNLVPGIGTFVTLCYMLCKGSYGTNRYGKDPIRRKFKKGQKR